MTLIFSLLMTGFLIASIVADNWNRTTANVLMLIAIAFLVAFLVSMIPTMGL